MFLPSKKLALEVSEVSTPVLQRSLPRQFLHVNWFNSNHDCDEEDPVFTTGAQYPGAVISPCDSNSKFSDAYLNCTGVVGVGISKKTGESVSFLTHHCPQSVIGRYSRRFRISFQKMLEEFHEEILDNSEQFIIFAGKDLPDETGKVLATFSEDYAAVRERLSSWIESCFGISPIVIPPNTQRQSSSNVFLDVTQGRLFIEKVIPNS